MDRSRRSVSRRRPLGTSASPQSASEASFDHRASVSPIMAHATGTPQTAPQARRASGKSLQHAFTFSTPGPNRTHNPKKRSKTTDNYDMLDDGENDDGPKKGGHSLRRRARVDYTFEHIDDDVVVPNSSSASRNKKRKSDIYDPEEFYGSGPKRRGGSVGADNQSTRRRNPARKSTETRIYREAVDDENDVQDTIEVGVSFSDLDDSDMNDSGHTTPSPDQSHKIRQPPISKSLESKSSFSVLDSNEAIGTFAEHIAQSPGQIEANDNATPTPIPEKAESQPSAFIQEPQPLDTKPSEESAQQSPKTGSDPTKPSEDHLEPPSEPSKISVSEPINAEVAEPPASASVTSPLVIKQEAKEFSVEKASSPPAQPPSIDSTVDASNKTITHEPEETVPPQLDSVSEEKSLEASENVDKMMTDDAEKVKPSDQEPTKTEDPNNQPISEPVVSDMETTSKPVEEKVLEILPEIATETNSTAVPESAADAIPAATLENPPQSLSDTLPQVIPESAPESTQEPVSETIAADTTATTLEPAPQAAVETVSETNTETIPETIREATPKNTLETAPEVSTEVATETAAEVVPAAPTEIAPQTVPETAPEVAPEVVPETVTEAAPETIAETTTEIIPAAVSETVPEVATETATEVAEESAEVAQEAVDDEILPEAPVEEKTEVSADPSTTVQTDAQSMDLDPVVKDQPSTAPSEKDADTHSEAIKDTFSEIGEAPKAPIVPSKWIRPQPTPVGKWAHLTPYIDGEFSTYPEKRGRTDDDGPSEDQTPEEKDADKEGMDLEPMVEDNDDSGEMALPEAPTPALNTPLRGSPVPDSADLTTFNSPAPAVEEADDAEVSESQEPADVKRCYRYRKLRDAEDYISAIENYEDMSTAELYETLEAINVSMVQWQKEWTGLSKIVDDYENSLRRRLADSKYESRTRNLHQHGVNYEEPDFVVKGYRAKEREVMSETRFLQGQDRIMAATYGFEYDPHPSKIGRQNPETQQVGIMTRGRSLRNQPRQTVKASEADEVTGKRQRKPVQLFDPATQDVSRSSTPVPTRGRRRRNLNGDDDMPANMNSSFDAEMQSDAEDGVPKRRKRAARQKPGIPSIVEDSALADDSAMHSEPTRSGRRARAKPIESYSFQDFEDEPQPELKQPRRHLLTLKIPKGKNFSEPSSAITDNGDSRPSTASSDSTSHTAESSYSFRPKRQKRFRDDPDESEAAGQAPPKKRGKRSGQQIVAEEEGTPLPGYTTPDMSQPPSNRKVQKIKVVRANPESRNGTPSSQPNMDEGDEPRKDYKSMTKSEKMSASMKSEFLHLCMDAFENFQTNKIQAAGQMATWLEPWRSERQHWQLRRPLKRRPSSALGPLHQSQRRSRPRRILQTRHWPLICLRQSLAWGCLSQPIKPLSPCATSSHPSCFRARISQRCLQAEAGAM